MPSSDFDIAIIVSDHSDPIEIAVKARLLRKEAFPLDIVVLRRSEAIDPIYREMQRRCAKALQEYHYSIVVTVFLSTAFLWQ
jgi:predicted nucleotidyltransferase